MKKLLLLLLVALLGAQVAMNTLADDTAMKALPDIGKVTAIDQIYNDLTLTGTVEQLDMDSGELVLHNDTLGSVALQFSPEEVQDLNIGDKAVVELGFGVDQRSITPATCEILSIRAFTC